MLMKEKQVLQKCRRRDDGLRCNGEINLFFPQIFLSYIKKKTRREGTLERKFYIYHS